MHVLWLIKDLGLGGAERMLVDALPYHDRGRWEIEAAYLLPWKGFLVPQLEALGVRGLNRMFIDPCLPRSWDLTLGDREVF